ncbi:MAG: ABC transporter ATP-binding protein [Microcystis wesenbergii TW10]|jgi:zinc transport system ATP-binding protein|uniref:ABC transporter ATP-binding protein n=3 Tax=Microcystis wesenbergii TaxID=44823 RepID=A0ABU3HL02_9CHRO|nr:ABC transporter ATP-binding protein [Microcystis wesenbergii]MDT3674405.1 ABC transporter ATP-binding protein [Microcystis wesenbergii NRERC-220]REJ46426.1 MAG: ABC transporter ATP-binding protein [Microcystis wesenbergii TW10]
MSTIITISNLWAGYEQEPILEDINLTIQELDFLGIIGPNGGGKTTLLKVLLGLIKPWRGEVSILGQSVEKGRELVGYVPQFVECDRSFPITVGEVVKMGRLSSKKLWQGYSKKDEVRVDKALDSVGMLALKKRSIAELSGGQRQRVYIARALAVEPRLLILDEPTASVDPQMRASIFSLLQELNEWMTILIISHDLGTLSTYVKSIGCLNRRLYYHGEKSLTAAMLEQVYC